MADISPKILKEATRQHAILSRGVAEILGGTHDSHDGLFWKLVKSLQNNKPLKVKFGMDPTASDLHLGHTVVLTLMRKFQDLGHIAMPLIGDGTTLIGDPSGRNSTRPLLLLAEIRKNAQTYLNQINKVLNTKKNYELCWNGDWLLKLNFQDVVELCSQVTVARIIEREDFTNRLKGGIPVSMHELLYPIMQGYDSVAMKCDIELGGTDQTFNCLMGRTLMQSQKMVPQIVITLPLLEGTDGVEKMSKSKNNYIGITDEPNDMFGKIMSISDAILPRYIELLTDWEAKDLPKHPMARKKLLGKEIVKRFYNEKFAENALDYFETKFSKKEIPDDIAEKTVKVGENGIGILKLLVELGFASSNSDARRLVKGNAIKKDAEIISDDKFVVKSQQAFVLQAGKKNIARVILV